MGVLQRFERRLEGLVEGAFARAFGGVVQPVELAASLQREAQAHKAIVGHGRVLVPNAYAVELSPADAERLEEYGPALRDELATVLREHAAEQGWSFVGPVTVAFRRADDVAAGVSRVSSSVRADEHVSARVPEQADDGAAAAPACWSPAATTGPPSAPSSSPARSPCSGAARRPTCRSPTPASAAATPRSGCSPRAPRWSTCSPRTAPASTAAGWRPRGCATATGSSSAPPCCVYRQDG